MKELEQHSKIIDSHKIEISIEKKKKENRKGIGGFLLNLLDELSWSMIP